MNYHRNMKQTLFLMIIFSLFLFPCLAQTNKGKTHKLNKPKIIKKNPAIPVSEKEKQAQQENDDIRNETSYYAPIRYVIVYDWIFDGLVVPERRMDILMDAEQLDKKNLITIFELIKKRFPTPLRLRINVHTSLDTIETPEEITKVKKSHTGRYLKSLLN